MIIISGPIIAQPKKLKITHFKLILDKYLIFCLQPEGRNILERVIVLSHVELLVGYTSADNSSGQNARTNHNLVIPSSCMTLEQTIGCLLGPIFPFVAPSRSSVFFSFQALDTRNNPNSHRFNYFRAQTSLTTSIEYGVASSPRQTNLPISQTQQPDHVEGPRRVLLNLEPWPSGLRSTNSCKPLSSHWQGPRYSAE